jgi:hypothetical protein
MPADRQRTEPSSERRSNRVIDLEDARVDRLVPGIIEELQAHGGALADVSALDSVERWRRAARRAGRSLGWRIRTGVSHGRAWAACEDWPDTSGPAGRARETATVLIVESPRWPVLRGVRSPDTSTSSDV